MNEPEPTQRNYKRALLEGREPTAEERAEAAAYQRVQRARHGRRRSYDADQSAAYRAAEKRLRLAHLDEFGVLYEEERAARGLPSVMVRRVA